MSIFTDVVSTFSKSLLTRILVVVVFLLCFAYVANGVGSWLSAKFSNEPTREELVDHAAKQGVVIETQDTALKQKDETIEMVKDLSTAAIRSMEDFSTENKTGASKSSQIKANLDKAETVHKAEVTKITVLEKDEKVKADKLKAADTRLAESQNMEIEEAYRLAVQRSGLAQI